MALDLKVSQVTVNEDGSYNVYIQVVDDITQKVLINKSVTASNGAELKDKVRPHWVKFKADYEAQQAIVAFANEKMDELEAE